MFSIRLENNYSYACLFGMIFLLQMILFLYNFRLPLIDHELIKLYENLINRKCSFHFMKIIIYLHKCFNLTTPNTWSWSIRPSSKSTSYFSMNIDFRYLNKYGCNKKRLFTTSFSFVIYKKNVFLVMIFDLGNVLLILWKVKVP